MNEPESLVELLEEFGEDELTYESPTRCPQGCVVETDGECPHGFKSVLLLAGL